MPITVPVQDEQTVQPRGLPSVSVTPARAEDITGGIEKGLATAGSAITAAVEKERKEQEDANYNAATAQLGEYRLEIQAGVKQKKGTAVFKDDLPGESAAALRKRANEMLAGMPSKALQDRFRAHALQEELGVRGFALGHTLSEGDAVKQDARNAAVEVALKKAENAATPQELEAARLEGLAALATGGEPAQAASVKFLGEIEKVSLGTSARAKAMELEAKYAKDKDGKPNPFAVRDAILEARDLPNEKLATATVTKLEQRRAELEKLQSDFDKDGLGRIVSRLERNNGLWDSATDPDYDKISDYAKGQADEKHAQLQRARRAQQTEDRRAAADARREQQYANDLAEKLFDALPLEARAGVDLQTGMLPTGQRLDPATARALAGVDLLGAASILAKQRRYKELYAKGEVVQFSEFVARVQADTAPLDDPDRAKAIQKGMEKWWFDYRDQHHGEMPGGVEVAKAFADQFTMVRTPGIRANKTRAEVRAEGGDPSQMPALPPEKQFSPAARAAAAAPAAPAVAAPTQTVSSHGPRDPYAALSRVDDIPADERKIIENSIKNPKLRTPAEILARANRLRELARQNQGK